MGPLASPLNRAVRLLLIFALLPWQEPARVFAQPVVAAPAAAAAFPVDNLPADLKKQVQAILDGAGRDAFTANARKAKLPDILARLDTLSDPKIDARSAQVVAARAELNGWVKAAADLKHDWGGDASAQAAYAALLAHVQKRHSDVSGQLDAAAAAAPIIDQLRGQLKGGPELEGELAHFQKTLAAYMKTGGDADMASAVGAMDALYQKAGIKDDGARAKMFTEIGAAARAQGDALAVRAGSGDGRPFTGYQGSARHVTDQAIAVPNVAPAPATNNGGTVATEPLRDAVGAAGLGLKDTVLGGLVPAVDLRALADNSAKLAARLEALAGLSTGPSEKEKRLSKKNAEALAAAYDAVSKAIGGAVMNAPYRDGEHPASAEAIKEFVTDAWPSQFEKVLAREAAVLGVNGPGLWGAAQAADEKFGKDLVAGAADEAGLPGARSRAAALVALLKALQSKAADLPKLSKEDRERLLGGQQSADTAKGREGQLGLYGQTLLAQEKDAAERRANGDQLMARIAALHLTGDPAKDMPALDKLFDDADVSALLAKADMPPAVAAYVRARAFEKDGAKGQRPDGLPAVDEAYRDVVFADRLLASSKTEASERRNWANLYLAHYDVNRKTFAALCGADAAKKAAGDAAEFCRRFAAAPKLADAGASAAALQKLALDQQAMTELVKDWLQHRPLEAAIEKDQAKRKELSESLRKLDPKAVAYLRGQGVDVDGLLRNDRKRLIASWLVSAHELGVDSDPARAAEWEAARSELFGPDAVAAVTAQSSELKRRLAEPNLDAGRIAEVLNGMENPNLITRGYAADVSRLRALPRALVSARDRDLLAAWDGQSRQLLGAADYYAGEAAKAAPDSQDAADLKARADLIRAAVADPKDVDRLLRAYRLSGKLVLDERSIRVGLDAGSVKARPSTEEEKLDFEALHFLKFALGFKGDPIGDRAAAAALRAKLLEKLNGDVSKSQDEYRGRQLLFSTSDQYTDQVRLLNDVVSRKVEGRDALRPGFAAEVLSTKAMQDLRNFLPVTSAAVDAMDAATQKLYDARQTRAGRAELDLTGSLAMLKAQTLAGLTDERFGLSGFTAHGWTIGREGDVTRVNGYQTAGAPAAAKVASSDGDRKIVSAVTGVDAPSADLPAARKMDGLLSVDGGVTTFVELHGKYTEKIEPATVGERVGGANVDVPVYRAASVPGVTGSIDVRYDAETKRYYTLKPVESLDGGGRFVSSQSRQYLSDADVKAASFERMQRVTIDDRLGPSRLTTTIDRTESGKVLRYSNSAFRDGLMLRTSVDLESHTMDVTSTKAGGPLRQVSFDLDEKNAGLAANRRFTESFLDPKTGKPVKPSVTTWLSLDKDKGTVRVLRDAVDVGDENVRVVSALSGEAARSGGDALLLRSRSGQPVGEPLSATVRVDREGRTREQMAAAYAHAADRVSQLFILNGKLAGAPVNSAHYAGDMARLMAMYDGSVGRGDVDAAFNMDPGGGFAAKVTYYDSRARKVVEHKGGDFVPLRYVSLPEAGPLDQPNLDAEAQKNLDYMQILAAMHLATNRSGLFVQVPENGDPPKRFFDPFAGRFRNISLGDKDRGGWSAWGGADINKPIFVDGQNAGNLKVDETTGVSNFHEHAGKWLGNYVRYQWKPFNDPKWDALAGGIVDGVTSGLLDPKLWLITAATMGGGLLVQAGAKSAIAIVRVAATAGKYAIKASEVYFQYQLVQGGIGSIKAIQRYRETGNNDDLYGAAQGLSAMATGFAALHFAKGGLEKGSDFVGEKLGLPARPGLPEGFEKPSEKAPEKPAEPPKPAEEPKPSEKPAEKPPEQQPDSRPPEHPADVPPERPAGPPPERPADAPPERPASPPSPPEAPRPPMPPGERAPAMPRVAESGLGGGGTLDGAGAARMEGGDLKPGGTGGTSNGAGAAGAAPKAAAPHAAAGEPVAAPKLEPPAVNKEPAVAPRPADPAVTAARGTANAETARASAAAERGAAARDASRVADARVSETQVAAKESGQAAASAANEAASAERMATRSEQRAGSLERAAQKLPAEKAAEAFEKANAAREEARAERERATEAKDRAETARQEETAARDEAAQAKKDASTARREARVATRAETVAAKSARVAERAAARAETAAARAPQPRVEPTFEEGLTPRETPGGGAAQEGVRPAPAETAPAAEKAAPKPASKTGWDTVKGWAKSADDWVGRTAAAADARATLFRAQFESSGNLAVRLIRAPLRVSRSVGSMAERLATAADVYGAALRLLGRAVEYDAAGRRLVTTKIKGVETKVPETPGVLRGTLIQAAQLLQGRPFPEGSRPETLEEIWNPRLTDRGSLRAALPKTIPPEGADVRAVLDLATGRLLFGREAERFAGSERADVTLRIEADGPKGRGRRIGGYELTAADPALRARASQLLADQFSAEFAVPQRQAALDRLLRSPEARDAMIARRSADGGSTSFDVVWDAKAGEFRFGASAREPGARLSLALDAEGGWRLVGAEPAGPALPFEARYNLALKEGASGSLEMRLSTLDPAAAVVARLGRSSLSAAELGEQAPRLAAESGLETVPVRRAELFRRVADGETAAVLANVEGSPRLVRLSNWRVETDGSGRSRVVMDLTDPLDPARPRVVAPKDVLPMLERLPALGNDAVGFTLRPKADLAAPDAAPAPPGGAPLAPKIEPALIRGALSDVRMDKNGPTPGERVAVADSDAARALRGRQNFNRTPEYPNSPVFAENSAKANDLFNRWLSGEESGMTLRQTMEEMHKLYAGKGEIGKGQGGAYAEEGAPVNGRGRRTRDFVRDSFGLEPNPDGFVSLPGIPENMSPYFLGKRYIYPDSSLPGMREAYYKALETQVAKYSELAARLEAIKAADPHYPVNAEYQGLLKETLDTVADFGRVAAAFRQFRNGNWGLYGPMMNSMVNRLGLEIKNPGFLDIILQGATEASVKPFFAESVIRGRDFYPADGYDPITGKTKLPRAQANAAVLKKSAEEFNRPALDAPPEAWTAKAGSLPKVRLERVISSEGSTGLVFEGKLADGTRVAVKTFNADPVLGEKAWPERLKYFENETSLYRVMEDALPKGWTPKFHGEVDASGNPSFATEMVIGKDPNNLTAREAASISESAALQAIEAIEALARKGYGGGDSPQMMVLTADQVINGVPRKAGELVFMDAGGLTTKKSRWMKPEDLAADILVVREVARRFAQTRPDATIAELRKEMPREKNAALRPWAEAKAARLPRPAAETHPVLSEESVGEPQSPINLPSPEKIGALRQLKNSLAARPGNGRLLTLVDSIYYTDPMTGLPNRAFFIDRGEMVLGQAKNPAVAMFDMNRFGPVNVGLAEVHGVIKGRERADEVLGVAGATFGELAKQFKVTVIHVSGEEFVALGEAQAVTEFTAAAKKTLTPQRLLDDAGMTQGTPERAAIEAAMARVGAKGGPAADFTYGIAELRGRTLKEATTAADQALAHGKDTAGRGAITLETPEGYQVLTEPSDRPALEELPRPPPNRVVQRLQSLEKRLNPQERAVLQEAMFKDPLTMTRSYEYLTVKERDWNKFYAEGGMVMLSSARNLKQINDILGHDAGDLYLRKLGVVMRSAINKARNERKLDVQEPVRVASKEFMLVGKDAKLVAELAAQAVADSFDGGRMLTPEQVKQVRLEAVKRGQVTEEGAKLIGTLRAVEEPIREQGGAADVRAALGRAFVSLEEMKNAETKSGARGANALTPKPEPAEGTPPPPPLKPVMKPSDLRSETSAPVPDPLAGIVERLEEALGLPAKPVETAAPDPVAPRLASAAPRLEQAPPPGFGETVSRLWSRFKSRLFGGGDGAPNVRPTALPVVKPVPAANPIETAGTAEAVSFAEAGGIGAPPPVPLDKIPATKAAAVAAARPASPLKRGQAVIDSNIAIALEKEANGVPVNASEAAFLAAVRAHGLEFRMTEKTVAELSEKPAKVQDQSDKVDITVSRTSSEYLDMIKRLESMDTPSGKRPVGGAKGADDRTIVADVFFARTEAGEKPILVTADRRIYRVLGFGGGVNPATGARLTAADLDGAAVKSLASGFDVTIAGRTIRVVPVVN